MAKYVLTGAAGFIGARTAEFLLEEGHEVIGIDNLNTAYDVRLKEHRLEMLSKQKDFQFHKIDISSKADVETLAPDVEGAAAIINLAAWAGVRDSMRDPWVYVDTNTTGTLNLLELARNNSIPKFVLASTSSIYGANAPIPTPETAESSKPLQAYAASKKGAEALCHAYHHLYGTDVTVVRYFTVYGPVGRPRMAMFRFVQWIMHGQPLLLNGDGSQTRGFTFVDDIARGTIQATKHVGYEIVNLGGHESISIIDLIRMMESKLGKQAVIQNQPFHKADMTANLANVSKAQELLGWQPQVDLEEGISRLIDWHMQEQSWLKDISLE